MVLTIEKGMSKEEIDKLISKFPVSNFADTINKKPIDMAKYFDKLKWSGDIIETQRRMRDDTNYSLIRFYL